MSGGSFDLPNINVGQTPQITPAAGDAGKSSDQTSSTLSKSEKAALQMLLEMGVPQLVAPWLFMNFNQVFNSGSSFSSISGINGGSEATLAKETGSVESLKTVNFLADVAASYQKIINNVLDAWVENVQQQADRQREELHSTEYLNKEKAKEDYLKAEGAPAVVGPPQYQAWLNTLSSSQAEAEIQGKSSIEEVRGVATALGSTVSNYIDQLSTSSNPKGDLQNLALLTAGLILTASNVSNSAHTAINPVQDTFNQSVLVFPATQQGNAALMINLFAIPMIYHTETDTLVKAAGKGEKPKSLDFARQFAADIVGLVTDNVLFNAMLKAIFTNKGEEAGSLHENRLSAFATKLKILLLSLALALLYKVETGKITDLEMAGLIKPKTSTSPEEVPEDPLQNIKATLSAGINAQLGLLTQSVSTSFLERLLAYMNTNPSLEQLLDPGQAVENMFASAKSGELSI